MSLFLLGVLSLFLAPSSSSAACFGATFDTIGSGFKYKAHLDTSNIDGACLSNSTRVTRMFIAGACSRHHDNDFDGYPPSCPPGDWNVMNTSSSTCERIFGLAMPSDIRIPQGNHTFDQGKICNDGVKSVIFVQTNCTQLNSSSVVRELSGEYCWDGKTLTDGELAGIIIGAAVAFALLISVPILLFACWRQRKAKRAMQALQRDVEASFAKHPTRPFGFGLSSGPIEAQNSDDSDDTYNIELETDSEGDIIPAHSEAPHNRRAFN